MLVITSDADAALINLYVPLQPIPGREHDTNIQRMCSKVDITADPLCLFPFTTTTFALAELLRIEFIGMEHYYSSCCA